jgi:SAM-dependent methyltransferase
MGQSMGGEISKVDVQEYWNAEPCGTRGLSLEEDSFFRESESRRYQLDGSLIFGFAEFTRFHGKRVLEIGVGTGTDFVQWARAGALAHGIDLTERGVELTRRRLAREKLIGQVDVGDAENLPFPDEQFDLVYSWGVLHHTPNPRKAIDEVRRVLVPGGEARIMLYHRRSWVALQAWLRYGVTTRRSVARVLSERVESPGTKAYTVSETRGLFSSFQAVRVQPRLTPYDTFDYTPRSLHGAGLRSLAQQIYPRGIVHALGDRFGWNLLINATK